MRGTPVPQTGQAPTVGVVAVVSSVMRETACDTEGNALYPRKERGETYTRAIRTGTKTARRDRGTAESSAVCRTAVSQLVAVPGVKTLTDSFDGPVPSCR